MGWGEASSNGYIVHILPPIQALGHSDYDEVVPGKYHGHTDRARHKKRPHMNEVNPRVCSFLFTYTTGALAHESSRQSRLSTRSSSKFDNEQTLRCVRG